MTKTPLKTHVGATSHGLPCHHTPPYIYTCSVFRPVNQVITHTQTHTVLKMALLSRVLINYSVVFLGLILLSGSICKADESVIEHVLTLDHSNLTQFVAKHDFIVVEFYAPW